MNIYRNFDANTICTEMIFTVALLFIHIKTKINISILIGYYKTWFYNMMTHPKLRVEISIYFEDKFQTFLWKNS